ncbi:hypothetical protein K438DRAFT_1783742 [Mycena galopus ATCC 62051]|nr:hypothetical protein K438DRAFT_1783742 [Mycena galopus ATCC 62051]
MREHSSLLPPPPLNPRDVPDAPPTQCLQGKRHLGHGRRMADLIAGRQWGSSPALNTQYFKCEHIRAAKGTYPAGAFAPASPLHIPHSARNQQTRQPQSNFEGGGDPNGSSDDELSDAPDSNNMDARAASPFKKDVLCPLQMSSSGFFNHLFAGKV